MLFGAVLLDGFGHGDRTADSSFGALRLLGMTSP